MNSTKYWWAQIFGWSVYALLNIYISSLAFGFSFKFLFGDIFLAAGGLGLTHFYRQYIHRHYWHNLKTNELIYRVLIGSILLAFGLCILQFVLLLIFYPEEQYEMTPTKLLTPFIAAYTIILIWNVLYFTWSYVEKNRKQMISQLEMQNEIKDMEIKSIKSNLQPHFIFNSLNSIRALISEDPETARESVTRLSKILRSSISTKEDAISLQKEISLVEDYLHLEKIRYEERLNYSIQIDEKTENTLVPPMLIQTLVENAVKHGIAQLEEGGLIEIKSTYAEDYILLEIINDGGLEQTHNIPGTGFGLKASLKRLQHLAGEDAKLEISEKNNRVHLQVLIPHHEYQN